MRFLEVNDAAVQNYGYAHDEFLAMTIKDIRPASDVARLVTNVGQSRQTLEHAGSWRHRVKGGEIIDVEITSHTITFADQPAALVVAQDITERKRAEQLLLRQTELSALGAVIGLSLANADATLSADGLWQQTALPRTQFNVRLEVNDIGKFLGRLHYPEGVRGGAAKLDGSVSWVGGPHEIDYPSLTGNIVLEANKGQFTRIEPGIGKLLGILSLQALPRRINLDFKDVFSEGFAFDEILGSVKINRGIATTDNFRMQGPPARIDMSGEVDLARETQKLRVRVTPAFSDSVSALTGLVNPLAGIGLYLAQKLFDDPLGKMASYQYDVAGTWSDPRVTKVPFQSSQAAEKQ